MLSRLRVRYHFILHLLNGYHQQRCGITHCCKMCDKTDRYSQKVHITKTGSCLGENMTDCTIKKT